MLVPARVCKPVPTTVRDTVLDPLIRPWTIEPEYVSGVAPVTIVSEPGVPVLLVVIVPPEPLKPATVKLNVLRSKKPPLMVSRPVPVAPLVIESAAPLPVVTEDTPTTRSPPVIVVPPLYVFAPASV